MSLIVCYEVPIFLSSSFFIVLASIDVESACRACVMLQERGREVKESGGAGRKERGGSRGEEEEDGEQGARG